MLNFQISFSVLSFFTLQTEQIINEYKIRALACHPDKHLENPKAGRYVDYSNLYYSEKDEKGEYFMQCYSNCCY